RRLFPSQEAVGTRHASLAGAHRADLRHPIPLTYRTGKQDPPGAVRAAAPGSARVKKHAATWNGRSRAVGTRSRFAKVRYAAVSPKGSPVAKDSFCRKSASAS